MNYYGTFTLYKREVKRFFKVYHQTVIAPAVNALVFFAIFSLATDAKSEFLAYGLIIMSIMQNAFANSSSSLIMGKVLGYIIDILMPPLSAFEITIAYVLGSITRGVIVGICVAMALSPFIDYRIENIICFIYFLLAGCCFLGLLGIFAGLYAKSFDQSAAIQSYIISPLSFLSGTFYSVDKLPIWLQRINEWNPFFYIVDGFRYSLSAYQDGHVKFGMWYLFFINIILSLIIIKLLKSGWNIKS